MLGFFQVKRVSRGYAIFYLSRILAYYSIEACQLTRQDQHDDTYFGSTGLAFELDPSHNRTTANPVSIPCRARADSSLHSHEFLMIYLQVLALPPSISKSDQVKQLSRRRSSARSRSLPVSLCKAVGWSVLTPSSAASNHTFWCSSDRSATGPVCS